MKTTIFFIVLLFSAHAFAEEVPGFEYVRFMAGFDPSFPIKVRIKIVDLEVPDCGTYALPGQLLRIEQTPEDIQLHFFQYLAQYLIFHDGRLYTGREDDEVCPPGTPQKKMTLYSDWTGLSGAGILALYINKRMKYEAEYIK